ncbi:hypothetical protein FRC07_005949 [Ceratobasidium sp. 392]|nr:hypothetical protein FRC07_005949 [Ceratobasidium sp. 392]
MRNLIRERRIFKRKTEKDALVTSKRNIDSSRVDLPRQSGQPLHRIFLHPDIIVLICFHLNTISSRLALRAVSRWYHALLKNAIYTHVILRPDGPSLNMLQLLLEEPSRCAGIIHMDLCLSLRGRLYVPGRDDLPELWRQREEFVKGIRTVLNQAPNLQQLCIRQEYYEEPLPQVPSFEGKNGEFPFKLKSCRIAGRIPGALEFIGTQTRMTHLILSEKSEPSLPPNEWHLGFSSEGEALRNLCALWATPSWMRALLMRSPVHTLGLLQDSRRTDIWGSDMMLFNALLQALGEIGGHPTVRCLALPFSVFFVSDSLWNLQALSKGFSKTQKLAITLEPRQYGWGLARMYVRRIGPVFQSVREFSFLLPGMWPHERFGTGAPYLVGSLGFSDDKDFNIPMELRKIMPELVHVDTVSHCYSRVGAGVKHLGYGYRGASLGGCDPVKVLGPEIRKGGQHRGVSSLNVGTPSEDNHHARPALKTVYTVRALKSPSSTGSNPYPLSKFGIIKLFSGD